jgi:hypothetical protein
LFCSTVAEARRITVDEEAALHVVGAQRARQGLKEQELDEAVRCAVRAGWSYFLDEVVAECESQQLMRDAMDELFERATSYSTDVLRALLRGFETENTQALGGYARVQATLIDRLVDGGWSDSDLFDAARADGVRLLSPVAFALVVEQSPSDDEQLHHVATRAAAILGVEEGPTRQGRTPHSVLLLNEATPAALKRLLGPVCDRNLALAGSVVALTDAVELADAPAAYEAVASRLGLARVARPNGGLVATDELGLYELLAQVPLDERTDLALRVLGPVLADTRSDELLEVFAAYLQFGKTERTRERLPFLKNPTMLWKRLQIVSKLTGLSLDVPRERTLLELAVRIYRGWIAPLAATTLKDAPSLSSQIRLVR